ncbi:ABC transporter A family member 7 isoform X1 [Elaeis guineensis]|uniref:ABC transporter A family member 7 isoform X1 n=1 Tax=Elaeis guineensis var. tenera TaxID=51953 RepID=A0A6I9RSQ1_ELAGV|nr:ABC transporter A family member 7 isoform X1 [Elaeis guineensis]
MEPSSRGPASFLTQANALLRKNLTFQKRNLKTNIGIIGFPVFICVVLVILQNVLNDQLGKAKYRCGCVCIDTNGDGNCETVCGLQYSTPDQVNSCPIPSPPKWPALLQVPRLASRAVRSGFVSSTDLPDASCKDSKSCPATVLFTGRNQTLAESLAGNLFKSTSSSMNFSDYLNLLSSVVPGSDTPTRDTQFIEPAFVSDRPLYVLQPQCTANFTRSVSFEISNRTLELEVECVQGLSLWRDSSSAVNDELFKGYRQENTKRKTNEYIAAYDILNSDENGFNLNIWYNSTYNNDTGYVPIALLRVPRSMNAASNAYLRFLRGMGVMMRLEYVKDMPKSGTDNRFDISSLLGALFFTWIVNLLLPVILNYLVYEKQQKLKIIMKMHGLKDGPYWVISYAYFFSLSAVYMICFVIFGSVIGLKFFTLNDYSIQFVFYAIYVNLQIVTAFLMAAFFSSVKTATVIGHIYVFASGLLGQFLLRFFMEDSSFPRGWIIVMEIVPGFSLYRGLYEFAQYAFMGDNMGTSGMRWKDLSDSQNGMRNVLIIMTVEWLVLLPAAYYLDQVASSGGIRRGPLFFLQYFQKKPSASFRKPSLKREESKVFVEMERPDVSQEREVVEQLLLEQSTSYAIISDNIKKVYPRRDGNPEKFAVRGLSLAVPHGECFGMLGPNGAGKTSFINMMTGLTTPTSGTAYVRGLDIRIDMDEIYTSMGVCPQHDLLWETLTGREHLLFYGRLKNLKGAALMQAVEESLKSVNLFYGGVGDKQAGKYSGGMKRRLSVAIALIGDPKVVYMDEPSTGLDPASRKNLWNVVKHAKRNRAIILTTHSMEEAEYLCDRLGVFVDGSLQCIGNPKELKARYGGSYVFTMTTSSNEEEEVESLVRQLSPSANRIYHISGTQKFEVPKHEVRIADVFRAVEIAKKKFTIHAWGLADTTLEDVFIKVAKGAQSFNLLS